MKKMNAPVMETVRFTEDDVIVASGAGNDNQSMFISGFGNNTTYDGFIRYNGTEYSGDNLRSVHENLLDKLNFKDPAMFNFGTNEMRNLSTFINSDLGKTKSEKDDAVSSDWNGSYYWNGKRFIKR